MMSRTWVFLVILSSFTLPTALSYRFGLGRFDITGPAADVNMMGYANVKQVTGGLHLRLFSRAFIIQDDTKKRPVLFVCLDVGMVSYLVKNEVIEKLKRLYPNTYDHDNVLLSATHTHSGPGGYFQSFLYSITSLGFVEESFRPLVDGIVQSIVMAHGNMMDGDILIAQGDLYNTSINRSPAAYLMNPVEERQSYTDNVDRQMTLLKFVTTNGEPVGILNWFAVHPVSMNESNMLISSDNKGLASFVFEEHMNKKSSGRKATFVAAFAQANEGDVSANTAGPRCVDTGLPCSFVHSTCNNYAQNCIAFGPGVDMFESTKLIGLQQVYKAMDLFDSAEVKLTGPVDFIHQFVDMTDVEVDHGNYSGRTCKAAMGYGFAAGTTDGAGDYDFIQGTTNGTALWDFIRDVLKRPSDELVKCQAPKPILLSTGEMHVPYPWQPDIVPLQILRIGTLLIVALPGEFTTMSGRRIRKDVENVAETWLSTYPTSQNPKFELHKFKVVLAGLSNRYTSYVATPEEYQLQRYEGASTIYGPLTLPAYAQLFPRMTKSLLQNEPIPPGPTPHNYKNKLISLLPGVFFDTAPLGMSFGEVEVQPLPVYPSANDVVRVRFVGASPRNNLRLGCTFLTVEQFNETSKQWIVQFTDANWETKFHWGRGSKLNLILGHSHVDIDWEVRRIDGGCEPGKYRIRYFGTSKSILTGRLSDFVGTSDPFSVMCL